MVTITLSDEQLTEVVEQELRDLAKHFESMLENDVPNMFVYNNPTQDKILIKAHLEAARLLIDWYKP